MKKEPLCYCGLATDLKISRTPTNPGRRFLGRRRYEIGEGCGFFRWVDPAIEEEHYKTLPVALIKKSDRCYYQRRQGRSKFRVTTIIIAVVPLSIVKGAVADPAVAADPAAASDALPAAAADALPPAAVDEAFSTVSPPT
ncbi:hypothetical protein A4A49_58926, partial [Nicotiana attenuata]